MREDERADRLARALDALVQGRRPDDLGDEELEELLQIAGIRLDAARSAAHAVAQQHEGVVWDRLQARIRAHAQQRDLTLGEPILEAGDVWPPPRVLLPSAPRGYRLSGDFWGRLWPKVAAAGAAAALLVAALGPIPSTGLANHPLAGVVRFVGDYVGVSETGAPPAVPSNAANVVEGTAVTLGEASALLGWPVWEPTSIPSGLQQVSSIYYPQPITAAEGGVFLLAYAGASGGETDSPLTILIYQERASGDDIAVMQGFASGRTLSDGTSATYVQGSWGTSGSQMVWGEDGAHSLVFERAGLRTIIHSLGGPEMSPDDLQTIAESMRAVVIP